MKHKILIICGWIYLTIGFACNPWFLGRLLSEDGQIHEPTSLIIIGTFNIIFIILGILCLIKNQSEPLLNLSLMFWSILILSPLLGEVLFRTGIGLNIPAFKSPQNFADPSFDNDYWKLQWDWKEDGGNRMLPLKRLHPLLGWTQKDFSLQNPLGLEDTTFALMQTDNPKVLFYGDSFVKGASDKEFYIPHYLNEKIPQMDVLDLSVGGYGMDQVYLMFQETYKKIAPPIPFIIVGILPNDDIDRTILSMRTSQKPYFEMDSQGQLQLQGVPINLNQKEYFNNYRLTFNSYFFAFLKHKIVKGNHHKSELKKHITAGLLKSFKSNADLLPSKIVFVIFYGQYSLTTVDWQEEFIKKELDRMHLPYIDTKDILLNYADHHHVKLSNLYVRGNGHHNNLGNQVITDGIIQYLKTNNYIQ